MNIFDVLRKRKQQRLESAGERYDRLVMQMANSEAVSAEEIEQIVTAANRTEDDLEREVCRLETRRSLASKRAMEPKLRTRLQLLDAEIAEHQKTYLEAERVFNEAVDAYRDRKAQIENQIAECVRAEQQLRESAPQSMKDQIAALGQETVRMQERKVRLHENRNAADAILRRANERLREIYHEAERSLCERDIKIAEVNLQQRMDELTECDAQMKALQQKKIALEAQMLIVK